MGVLVSPRSLVWHLRLLKCIVASFTACYLRCDMIANEYRHNVYDQHASTIAIHQLTGMWSVWPLVARAVVMLSWWSGPASL